MKNKVINPLLHTFETPFETIPFHRIEPEHFKQAFPIKIKEAKKYFKHVIRSREAPTFENTIQLIEERYDDISRMGLILFNLNSAETNARIQSVTQVVSPQLTKFIGDVLLNKKYFRKVEYLYFQKDKSGLSSEQLRLLETTYQSMKRNGADLGLFRKLRLIRIQMKLSKLTLKFNENILSETNQFKLHITNKIDLAGLPDMVIETASIAAKKEGLDGWIFTLQYPSFSPFMKFSENRDLRKKLYVAYTSRGNNDDKNDNKVLIRKIVNLRLKQAKLLGYRNYAQYVLEERMADTPETVESFLLELYDASLPSAKEELQELNEFALKNNLDGSLQAWDTSYLGEKLKISKYGFDEEMVKPYFQLESVIDGVFGLASDLYDLSIKSTDTIPVYFPDVKTYEVYDHEGKFLAILYTDFFPRKGKQGGAWMTEYRAQSNINGKMIRPHISICCNFTKPTNTKPSLLTFTEISTFLHEFGHALHGMLANTVYPSLSGTNVYRDFVELPSQIMENWALEVEWLNKFAVHFETGEPMPAELIEKLIAARNFQSGIQTIRQLAYAMTDMAWHSVQHSFKEDVIAFERKVNEKTQLLPYIDGTSISTSFSHIFSGGYASGYYGYKWAEVLDADAFSLFSSNGIFDKYTASLFRKEILEKGGTAHPMELFKKFKGNEPSIDPLLIRSGLK